jgi:hypothetical protein
MVEITGSSRAVGQRTEPLSWLQRMFLGLARSVHHGRRAGRIDEHAWSEYMLRDVGLDEARLGRGGNPRELPFDWPLR